MHARDCGAGGGSQGWQAGSGAGRERKAERGTQQPASASPQPRIRPPNPPTRPPCPALPPCRPGFVLSKKVGKHSIQCQREPKSKDQGPVSIVVATSVGTRRFGGWVGGGGRERGEISKAEGACCRPPDGGAANRAPLIHTHLQHPTHTRIARRRFVLWPPLPLHRHARPGAPNRRSPAQQPRERGAGDAGPHLLPPANQPGVAAARYRGGCAPACMCWGAGTGEGVGAGVHQGARALSRTCTGSGFTCSGRRRRAGRRGRGIGWGLAVARGGS